MSVIVELSLFPMDKGTASLAPYVARVLKVLEDSGLPFELNAMGTCVEGEWPEVLAVTGRCMEELQKDAERVYLLMKADWRRGRKGGLKTKVASVGRERAAGR